MQGGLLEFSSVARPTLLFDIPNMPDAALDTDENPPIYQQLMRFKPTAWSPNKWAVEAGVSRTVWADIRKHGNPNRRTLEKLLAAAGSSVAEFEALRTDVTVRTEVAGTGMSVADAERAWRGAPRQKPIPHLGVAVGGEYGEDIEMVELHLAEVLDYMTRPGDVTDPAAYGLTIVGNSMSPRFKPGERIIVSPRAPASIGDDVVVQLRAEADPDSQLADRVTMVLIKELVRKTAKYVELRQHNPDRMFHVPIERVAAIHRVLIRI